MPRTGALSRRQKAKIVIMLMALFLFSGSMPMFPFSWIWVVMFFAGLIMVSEYLDVTLPQGSHVSVSSAFIIAMIYIMPMQPALAAAGLGLSVATLLRERHGLFVEMFYGPAKNIVSLASGYGIYYLFALIVPTETVWSYQIGRLAAAASIYYLIDTLLDQLNLPYSTFRYLLRSYFSSWKLAGTTYLALASSGLLIAVTFSQIGYWGILLLCLPLLVIRHSFRLYINIKKTYQNTIEALASAIETQDPRRRGHAKRVAEYSIAIARELGIYGDELETLGYGALLHDIGKIGVDDSMDTIDGDAGAHERIGAEIVENVSYLPGVSKIIADHHKPHALSGSGIINPASLSSRIVCVASAFDNMVNMGTFGQRLSSRDALKRLKRQQGSLFDPVVTRALAETLKHSGQLSFRF